MSSRSRFMLNLALSSAVDFQNIRNDNKIEKSPDSNLQNGISVTVRSEKNTNIEEIGKYDLKLLTLNPK